MSKLRKLVLISAVLGVFATERSDAHPRYIYGCGKGIKRCLARTGAAFVVDHSVEELGNAWRDEESGLIWGEAFVSENFMLRKLSYDEAVSHCASIPGAELPTMEDFLRLRRQLSDDPDNILTYLPELIPDLGASDGTDHMVPIYYWTATAARDDANQMRIWVSTYGHFLYSAKSGVGVGRYDHGPNVQSVRCVVRTR